MRYRQMGQWGLKVSEIALGAWTTYGGSVTDRELIGQITRTAYEGGVNFFDNADAYARGAAEDVMGEVLSEYPRHTLVMSSKVYWPMSKDVNDRGLSRKHLRESIVGSLR
ncbi:MAG: aldo/keto reductase, partial [Acidimicrobiia bacterium]